MGSEDFSHFFRFFFVFLRFSSFFACSPGTRANDCNLLGKWARLHRPRSELPDSLFLDSKGVFRGNFWLEEAQSFPEGLRHTN